VSVFPSKVRPGRIVTLHLRVGPSEPLWVHKKDFIVDPNGKRIQSWDCLTPLLPVQFDDEEWEINRNSEIGFQAQPILMAARYLAPETRDLDFFISVLNGLRSSTHMYPTYQVPKDAPLGRCGLESET